MDDPQRVTQDHAHAFVPRQIGDVLPVKLIAVATNEEVKVVEPEQPAVAVGVRVRCQMQYLVRGSQHAHPERFARQCTRLAPVFVEVPIAQSELQDIGMHLDLQASGWIHECMYRDSLSFDLRLLALLFSLISGIQQNLVKPGMIGYSTDDVQIVVRAQLWNGIERMRQPSSLQDQRFDVV